jgi:hypothetical protein
MSQQPAARDSTLWFKKHHISELKSTIFIAYNAPNSDEGTVRSHVAVPPPHTQRGTPRTAGAAAAEHPSRSQGNP